MQFIRFLRTPQTSFRSIFAAKCRRHDPQPHGHCRQLVFEVLENRQLLDGSGYSILDLNENLSDPPAQLQTQELIRNGSFTQPISATDWVASGDFHADTSHSQANSPPGFAWLGDSDGQAANNLAGAIYQQFTIPSDATSATLSYWFNITTNDTSSSVHDILNVWIQDSAGKELSLLDTCSNLNSVSQGQQYQQHTINLSPFTGQTVRLAFLGSTDATQETIFRIDDVSILVETPTAPATIAVVSPNGGETFQVGTSYSISWTISGDTSNIASQEVALSLDGGSTWSPNLSPTGGLSASDRSFSFTPNVDQLSTSALIRVRALDAAMGVTAEDISDDIFSIACGEPNPTMGTVKGWVYIDANRNGQPDAGECLPGVTVELSGEGQNSTATDDSGWYQFEDIPAGSYQVCVAHPKACMPGGPDSIAANVTENQELRIDFWDAGLRPECIPNSLLATSSLPVGSARWNQAIRDALARAEELYCQVDTSKANNSLQLAVVQQATPTGEKLLAAEGNLACENHGGGIIPNINITEQSAAKIESNSAQTSPETTISQETLVPIVQEAIAQWETVGLEQETIDKFNNTSFEVSNLAGLTLGMTVGHTVHIDQNAANNGWFIDPSPARDEEFYGQGKSLRAIDVWIAEHMDLLSVVAHELGHVAGLTDMENDISRLMYPTLNKGVRRIPGLLEHNAVFALGNWAR
jgi:hypothetical protein